MTQQFHYWSIYPENIKTLIWKDSCTFYIHCSIICNSQNMEATQLPIDRCMVKDVIYTHTHTVEYWSWKRMRFWEFPGNPVVIRLWAFTAKGPGSIFDWGTKILQVMEWPKQKQKRTSAIGNKMWWT